MSKKKRRKYKKLKQLCQEYIDLRWVCKQMLEKFQPLYDNDLAKEFQDPGRYYIPTKFLNQLQNHFLKYPT